MHDTLRRVRAALIAIVVFALSAGLAFGAQPPSAASTGLANAAAHAGKIVPVAGAQAGEDEGEDEGEGEEGDEVEDVEDEDDATEDEDLEGDEEGAEDESAGENCATDPTLLTEDELAAMNHGSLVCWAAHQTEWPEEFKNHGAWVKSWAQWRKDGEEAEDGETVDGDGSTLEDAGPTRGNGKGKGKNKSKPNRD